MPPPAVGTRGINPDSREPFRVIRPHDDWKEREAVWIERESDGNVFIVSHLRWAQYLPAVPVVF